MEKDKKDFFFTFVEIVVTLGIVFFLVSVIIKFNEDYNYFYSPGIQKIAPALTREATEVKGLIEKKQVKNEELLKEAVLLLLEFEKYAKKYKKNERIKNDRTFILNESNKMNDLEAKLHSIKLKLKDLPNLKNGEESTKIALPQIQGLNREEKPKEYLLDKKDHIAKEQNRNFDIVRYSYNPLKEKRVKYTYTINLSKDKINRLKTILDLENAKEIGTLDQYKEMKWENNEVKNVLEGTNFDPLENLNASETDIEIYLVRKKQE